MFCHTHAARFQIRTEKTTTVTNHQADGQRSALRDQFCICYLILSPEILGFTPLPDSARFFDDICLMIGKKPWIWWKLCWKGFSPALIIVGLCITFLLNVNGTWVAIDFRLLMNAWLVLFYNFSFWGAVNNRRGNNDNKQSRVNTIPPSFLLLNLLSGGYHNFLDYILLSLLLNVT